MTLRPPSPGSSLRGTPARPPGTRIASVGRAHTGAVSGERGASHDPCKRHASRYPGISYRIRKDGSRTHFVTDGSRLLRVTCDVRWTTDMTPSCGIACPRWPYVAVRRNLCPLPQILEQAHVCFPESFRRTTTAGNWWGVCAAPSARRSKRKATIITVMYAVMASRRCARRTSPSAITAVTSAPRQREGRLATSRPSLGVRIRAQVAHGKEP